MPGRGHRGLLHAMHLSNNHRRAAGSAPCVCFWSQTLRKSGSLSVRKRAAAAKSNLWKRRYDHKQARRVCPPPPGVGLDLGGIAKRDIYRRKIRIALRQKYTRSTPSMANVCMMATAHTYNTYICNSRLAYRGMVGSLKVPEKRLSRWGS